jgi:hypothetical protein
MKLDLRGSDKNRLPRGQVNLIARVAFFPDPP